MTETGMVLSNPLDGERRPGYVGVPLPGASVRLVDDEGQRITGEGVSGRIQVRGPGLFLEYWGRLEETRAAHQDAWLWDDPSLSGMDVCPSIRRCCGSRNS